MQRIDGNTVHFVDGSQLEVDAVIYATGYHTDFPFLPTELLKVEENRIPLFQRIFLPEVPNLAFIGLFQAVTWGFLDMMERQAELTADYFAGQYLRPEPDSERQHIAAERKVIEREFLATPRNNYEMHGPTYMHYLAKELRQGRDRAKATGSVSPLLAQAYAYDAVSALAQPQAATALESDPCQG